MIKIIDEMSWCPLCGRTCGNFNGNYCEDNHCDNLIFKDVVKDRKLLSKKFIEECKKEVIRRYGEINTTIRDHSKDYARLEFDMLLKIYIHLLKNRKTKSWDLEFIWDRLEEISYCYDFELKEELKDPKKICKHCGSILK